MLERQNIGTLVSKWLFAWATEHYWEGDKTRELRSKIVFSRNSWWNGIESLCSCRWNLWLLQLNNTSPYGSFRDAPSYLRCRINSRCQNNKHTKYKSEGPWKVKFRKKWQESGSAVNHYNVACTSFNLTGQSKTVLSDMTEWLVIVKHPEIDYVESCLNVVLLLDSLSVLLFVTRLDDNVIVIVDH